VSIYYLQVFSMLMLLVRIIDVCACSFAFLFIVICGTYLPKKLYPSERVRVFAGYQTYGLVLERKTDLPNSDVQFRVSTKQLNWICGVRGICQRTGLNRTSAALPTAITYVYSTGRFSLC
jgi:hypothetical protein